jgi:protein O-mannosyl-transferase
MMELNPNQPAPPSDGVPVATTESMPTRTATPVPAWLLAVLLALVTTALYWPAMRCGFVNYDDPAYVASNPRVQTGLTLDNLGWAFSTSETGNWHPVTWLSLMLDASLFGKGAAGFHFTNLALHAINAVLLFLLLRRLTGSQWRSAGVAALFACHPAHVESVAWVAERKDVLCACFGFLALWFYADYARARAGRDVPVSHSSSAYALAWVCFAMGLLSKPMLVTWPFVLLLLDYWPLGRFRPGQVWPLVREKIPFLALALVASVVTFLAQKHEGVMATVEKLTLGERSGNAVISYCRYLGKLCWPTDLAVIYPYCGHWPWEQVLLAGGLLTLISAMVWVRRRQQPFLLVGWLWFTVTLVPVIGLVQVGAQAMADRYTYIPSVGVLLLAIWGGHELTRRWRHQSLALGVAGTAVIVLCFVLTRQQLGYWQDSETLFRHALAVTENNSIAYNNLGSTLLDQGRTDAAVTQFQAELRLQPDDADAHNNLGMALFAQGQTNLAITQFQTAFRLKPQAARFHCNLGDWFAKYGEIDEAISQFQEGVRLDPACADAHFNLGIAYLQENRLDEAVSQIEAGLRLNPVCAAACFDLGNAFFKQGRTDEAIAQFQEALRLQPDYAIAHNYLGVVFGAQGRSDEAIHEFQEALRFKPDYAAAHNHLGFALAAKGQIDGAISQFQEALRLQPDNVSAQHNLARALAQKSQSQALISDPVVP